MQVGPIQSPEGLNKTKVQGKGEFTLCLTWDISLLVPLNTGTTGSWTFWLRPGLIPSMPHSLAFWLRLKPLISLLLRPLDPDWIIPLTLDFPACWQQMVGLHNCMIHDVIWCIYIWYHICLYKVLNFNQRLAKVGILKPNLHVFSGFHLSRN